MVTNEEEAITAVRESAQHIEIQSHLDLRPPLAHTAAILGTLKDSTDSISVRFPAALYMGYCGGFWRALLSDVLRLACCVCGLRSVSLDEALLVLWSTKLKCRCVLCVYVGSWMLSCMKYLPRLRCMMHTACLLLMMLATDQ